MKCFKKLIICLLAMFVLVGSQATYVSAAAASEASVCSPTLSVSKEGITVEFHFDYVDGKTVYFTVFRVEGGYGSYDFKVTHNSFSNDRRTVIVTATDIYTGAKITFGAWCDIYGEADTF